MSSGFVHLHTHSDYSLLDGAQTLQTLIQTVSDLDMEAVALTEHGNMFGAVTFYKAARKARIKPILGCEVYVAKGSRFDKTSRAHSGWGNNHLLLLAQNYTGYRNLLKLVTAGYLEGFYYRPRVDKELLRSHSEGLICSSACLKGEVSERLLAGDWPGARQAAGEYAEIFPGRFYLEIQDHGMAEEQVNREAMVRLARELSLPLLATNDAHYARREHADAHDIHICLGTGKNRDDPNRLRYATPEFYLKSEQEMRERFRDFPEALENSLRIAASVDLKLPIGDYHLPRYRLPEDSTHTDVEAYLRDICCQGLKDRYGTVTPELEARLNRELAVISKMKFAGYFLITADFVQYARRHRIPVGPGRGSAAGSLVAYSLGITTIDPIKHNLLFERFLNPDRISMPDIDIDFCIDRRGEVIDYIKRRYGENSVTQIITFGKMKARQVVRDVGRVLGFPFGEVDRLAKMIPAGPYVTLEEALNGNPELKALVDSEPRYRELMDHSLVLEGMNRHASTHAAGVVIVPGDLTDYVPLYKSPQGDITSQYDMKGLEDLGLLKMDFLGLRNLTVINQAVRLLKARDIEVDIEKIPMDDPRVYKLFARGMTTGVFQFESSGMREFLKKLKPTVIEDLIAMNALYRPGPMENIEDFIKRKQGRKKIRYIHPLLEPILKETYGIIVYQEQVMQLAHEVGGLSLAEADLLRRAMGKKIQALMTRLRNKFIEGAQTKGLTRKTAEDIYALIDKFAKYGFNKSHSTAYAYIAYQTAWLKTHYPAEFMAANLTSEMSNIDRVVILINECRKLGITVTPPDINVSHVNFRPTDDRTISFGLNAIKNVGTRALEHIIEAREGQDPFQTLFELCTRVDLRAVNKKVLESLIMSGALDSLEGTRAQKFAAVDTVLRQAQQYHTNRNLNQVDMFSAAAGDAAGALLQEPALPVVEEWDQAASLAREKEVLGLYLSGHPLLKYAHELETYSNFDFSEELDAGLELVRIGGTIRDLRLHYDRKHKEMAFFSLECLGGSADITIFHDLFVKYRSEIYNDNLVFVTGKPSLDSDFNDLKLLAEEIVPLEKARQVYSRHVNVRLDPAQMNTAAVEAIYDLATQYQGESGLMLHVANSQGNGQRFIAHKLKVSPKQEFLQRLTELCGKNNVWVE